MDHGIGSLDKPKDECGVFGIWGPCEHPARTAYFGLHALQHRGQERAGIAVTDGRSINVYKGMGLVTEVFNDNILKDLKGTAAIGHVRYSTKGTSSVANAQPLVFRYSWGSAAFAHNGNLINAARLARKLAGNGAIFQSTSDTEVFANLVARYGNYGKDIVSAVKKAVADIHGAYSIIIMTRDKMIGVRDPYGVRPLCLGKLNEAYVLASETCALGTIGAKFERFIEPGEIVVIDNVGIQSSFFAQEDRQGMCIFEYVYLARPDSTLDAGNVAKIRMEFGRQLAAETNIEADMVIPVPDSGNSAALGYSLAKGIPNMSGLIKNRYVGRTFIQPSQKKRDLGVRMKLHPVREILEGQRVIMIDDSIVRGTTSRKIVQLVRDAGAKEVHMVISSPPVLDSCYYGIDTAERDQLIGSKHTTEEICRHIGADSLHYLSLEGMLKAVGLPANKMCTACFNRDYPAGVPEEEDMNKNIFEEGW
jgi:amidophosphoribosyltransferase